jgi:hypothetical protein
VYCVIFSDDCLIEFVGSSDERIISKCSAGDAGP